MKKSSHRTEKFLGVATLIFLIQNRKEYDVLSLFCGLLSCLFWFVGFIFAIPGLILGITGMYLQADKKNVSIPAIIFNLVGLSIAPLIAIPVGIHENKDLIKEAFTFSTTESTEVVESQATASTWEQEIATTEAEPERTILSLEEFEEQAIEVSYDDLINNPNITSDRPIKVNVYVDEYASSNKLFISNYYGLIGENNYVYLNCEEEHLENEVAAFSCNITFYGYCDGIKDTPQHGEIPYLYVIYTTYSDK